MRKPILEFVRAVCEDYVPRSESESTVEVEARNRARLGMLGLGVATEEWEEESEEEEEEKEEDRVYRNGFVLEVGRDLVGFKVVEAGRIIF